MPIEIAADVGARRYDAVIVGAGMAGSLVAKTLARAGARVLLLEAGGGQGLDYSGYQKYVQTYYAAAAKVPNSPYPANANAPQSNVLDVVSDDPIANSMGYLVQRGPQPFRSDYVRAAGGTMLHWLGTCLRMLPEDFETKTRFGVGLDWPLTYAELKPWYEKAELEIGVSAEAEDQNELASWLGTGEDWIGRDYVYPMHRIPTSYVDRMFRDGVTDMDISYDGASYKVRVSSTPQGRNSIPNERYPGGYRTAGAAGNPDIGHRCQGNSSCVPICPVQAKYNALKTLSQALETGRVDLVTQAVASRVAVGADGGIAGIEYKAYQDPNSGAYDCYEAHGAIYVLAAHAIENAKLMLASGLGGPATGLYLMDHPCLLTWGLADRALGTFRGPGSTSGIESLRAGAFRKRRSPFRVEIDNWGWNWVAGAPVSTVQDLLYEQGLFGPELRQGVFDQVQRQVRLGFEFEVPADPDNRITIDPGYRDRLDNYRPVLTFNIKDYVRAGFAEGKRTSDLIYAKLGITDCTKYIPGEAGYVAYAGAGYTYYGAGHCVGGHVMGTDKAHSVVNADQRAWDHGNLWLVGCGSMPSEGTSNPTLTMTALALRTAEKMRTALGLSV